MMALFAGLFALSYTSGGLLYFRFVVRLESKFKTKKKTLFFFFVFVFIHLYEKKIKTLNRGSTVIYQWNKWNNTCTHLYEQQQQICSKTTRLNGKSERARERDRKREEEKKKNSKNFTSINFFFERKRFSLALYSNKN